MSKSRKKKLHETLKQELLAAKATKASTESTKGDGLTNTNNKSNSCNNLKAPSPQNFSDNVTNENKNSSVNSPDNTQTKANSIQNKTNSKISASNSNKSPQISPVHNGLAKYNRTQNPNNINPKIMHSAFEAHKKYNQHKTKDKDQKSFFFYQEKQPPVKHCHSDLIVPNEPCTNKFLNDSTLA